MFFVNPHGDDSVCTVGDKVKQVFLHRSVFLSAAPCQYGFPQFREGKKFLGKQRVHIVIDNQPSEFQVVFHILAGRFNDLYRIIRIFPDGIGKEYQQVILHVGQEIKLASIVFIEGSAVNICPLAKLPDGNMIDICLAQQLRQRLFQHPPGHCHPAVFFLLHRFCSFFQEISQHFSSIC